jgi:hypothetical protein
MKFLTNFFRSNPQERKEGAESPARSFRERLRHLFFGKKPEPQRPRRSMAISVQNLNWAGDLDDRSNVVDLDEYRRRSDRVLASEPPSKYEIRSKMSRVDYAWIGADMLPANDNGQKGIVSDLGEPAGIRKNPASIRQSKVGYSMIPANDSQPASAYPAMPKAPCLPSDLGDLFGEDRDSVNPRPVAESGEYPKTDEPFVKCPSMRAMPAVTNGRRRPMVSVKGSMASRKRSSEAAA